MSKSADRQALDAAIRANKRLLALLDKEIAEAASVQPSVRGYEADQSLPFWYVTIDPDDDLPGILLSPATSSGATQNVNEPNYGIVQTDGDAAFVCTSVFACARMVFTTDDLTLGASNGYFDIPTAQQYLGLGVRLVDLASDRRITLMSNSAGIGNSMMTPLEVFGQSAQASPGGLILPAECTFPRNSTIRVEAFLTRALSTALSSCRLSLVFHGYKVFGG